MDDNHVRHSLLRRIVWPRHVTMMALVLPGLLLAVLGYLILIISIVLGWLYGR